MAPPTKTSLAIQRKLSGAVFAVGLLVAWILGRVLGRRVRTVASAARSVAAGDLSTRDITDLPADEVGRLETAKREQERLELLLAERTAELSERNAAMRRVLDHVAQGLAPVGRDGSLGGERSRAFADWFATPPAGAKLWDVVAMVDPIFGARLRVSWEMLDDPDLPLDLVMDAFPTVLRSGDRFLRFEYRPIEEDGVLANMLVVVSDVTSEVERRRADEAERELVALVEHVLTDRGGCLEFVSETDRLLASIDAAATASPAFLRAVHTLKGNCLLFGQQTLADLCHITESVVRDTGALPCTSELAALSTHWQATKTKLALLLGEGRRGRVDITEDDYEALRSAIPFASRPELARMVARLRLEPVSKRFQRLSQQATALAARLGKRGVRVVTDARGVRLDAETWAPFWSAFVHVVRNAVDHGIESPRERAELGKQHEGIIVLRAHTTAEQIFVEISDDGRGIDWSALECRSRELGVGTRERVGLEDLLFRDGVTTRVVADESSGRGVGLGAVREACRALGGRVQVESKVNHGTLLRFAFPASAASAGALPTYVARAA